MRFFCLIASFLLLQCMLPYSPAQAGKKLTIHEKKFYRSVFILQQLEPISREEKILIPKKVIDSDETESLQHHPDKVFVLRQVASDLNSVKSYFPKATLMEAFAWNALGERKKTADLLNSYIASAPYNSKYYAFLCKTFKLLNDNLSLFIISNEWKEKDASCIKKRVIYTWTALFNLKRYDSACRYALEEKDCLEWKSFLFAARVRQEQERLSDVESLLSTAKEKFPDKIQEIDKAWEKLKFSLDF